MNAIPPIKNPVFTGKLLQKAFEKVCYRRREYSSNNDIWELRHNWSSAVKLVLLNKLDTGNYILDAVKVVLIEGQIYEIWSSQDAVVIEALTMLLKDQLNITKIVIHII